MQPVQLPGSLLLSASLLPSHLVSASACLLHGVFLQQSSCNQTSAHCQCFLPNSAMTSYVLPMSVWRAYAHLRLSPSSMSCGLSPNMSPSDTGRHTLAICCRSSFASQHAVAAQTDPFEERKVSQASCAHTWPSAVRVQAIYH